MRWDLLYQTLMIVSAISCSIVAALLLVFAFRYHAQGKGPSTPLFRAVELFWSIVPVVICFTAFAWGWGIYQDLRRPTPDKQVSVRVKM